MMLDSVWAHLLDPVNHIDDSEERRRARQLAGLLVVLIPLTFMGAVSGLMFMPPGDPFLPVQLLILTLLVFSYGLSRSPKYWLGALIMITAVTVQPFIIILSRPHNSPFQIYMALSWLVMSVIFSNLFLKGGQYFVIAGGTVLALVVLPLIKSDVSYQQMGYVLSLLVVVGVILQTMTGIRGRDLLKIQAQARALAESEARLKALFNQATEYIVIMDPAPPGRPIIVDGSESFFQQHGYLREELIGKSISLLDGEKAPEGIEEHNRRVMAGEQLNFEMEHVRKDGTKFPVEGSAKLIEAGGKSYIISIERDITLRRKREAVQAALFRIAEAAISTGNLEDLYRSLHEIVGQLMPAKNFVIALGDRETELIDFVYFIDEMDEPPPKPERRGQGLTEYVMSTEQPLLASRQVMEEMYQRNDAKLLGTPAEYWLGVPLKLHGEVFGIIAVQSYDQGISYGEEDRDLLVFVSTQVALAIAHKREESARIDLVEQLSERNERLEQILRISHHDLRAPLYNILGFSRVLEKATAQVKALVQPVSPDTPAGSELAHALDEEIPKALSYIQSSAIKIESLQEGLLRLAKLGRAALHIEQLDMNALLAGIVATMRYRIEEGSVQVEVDALSSCRGDKIQVDQIFTNLLDNALKFLHPDQPAKIKITSQDAGSNVVYRVQDNGRGIPANQVVRIFDLFHRVEPAGTAGEGLGLSIIQKILERHKGKIWVESAEGQGSTFFVSLPR
ncbi:MAG: ATP-binding protein [Candidatus Neomarinimicrobiota bacterium]